MTSQPASAAEHQATYGPLQPKYWPLFALVGVIGLIGVPVGIFFNEGWRLGVQKLEPWSAMLIIEIIAGGALLLTVWMILREWRQRARPQRLAIAAAGLIVPRGDFSSGEITLPWNEIEWRVFNVGFVKQLQVTQRGKKRLYSSAFFESTAAFDHFVEQLPASTR